MGWAHAEPKRKGAKQTKQRAVKSIALHRFIVFSRPFSAKNIIDHQNGEYREGHAAAVSLPFSVGILNEQN